MSRLTIEETRIVRDVFKPLSVTDVYAPDPAVAGGTVRITLSNLDGDSEKFVVQRGFGTGSFRGMFVGVRCRIYPQYTRLRLLPMVREFSPALKNRIRLGLLRPGTYDYFDGDMQILMDCEIARVQPTTEGTYAILDVLGIWRVLKELCETVK